MEDDKLARLAELELLREAQRGGVRAELAGASAWLPGTVPSTDKRFLSNALRHVLASNRVRSRRPASSACRDDAGPSAACREDRPQTSGSQRGSSLREHRRDVGAWRRVIAGERHRRTRESEGRREKPGQHSGSSDERYLNSRGGVGQKRELSASADLMDRMSDDDAGRVEQRRKAIKCESPSNSGEERWVTSAVKLSGSRTDSRTSRTKYAHSGSLKRATSSNVS